MSSAPSNADILAVVDEIQNNAAELLIKEAEDRIGAPALWNPPGADGVGLDPYLARFGHIRGIFEKFLEPDGAALQDAAKEFYDSGSGNSTIVSIPDDGIVPENEQMDCLETAINKSEGKAFEKFANNYLDKFDQTWYNHALFVRTLGVTAEATGEAYLQARVDLLKIGKAAAAVLEQLQNTVSAELGDTLGVISSVTGILALAPPLRVPAGVVSEVSGILSTAIGLVSSEDKQYMISGDDTQSVIDSMCNCIELLEEDLRTALNNIADTLRKMNDEFEANTSTVVIEDVNFPGPADIDVLTGLA